MQRVFVPALVEAQDEARKIAVLLLVVVRAHAERCKVWLEEAPVEKFDG